MVGVSFFLTMSPLLRSVPPPQTQPEATQPAHPNDLHRLGRRPPQPQATQVDTATQDTERQRSRTPERNATRRAETQRLCCSGRGGAPRGRRSSQLFFRSATLQCRPSRARAWHPAPSAGWRSVPCSTSIGSSDSKIVHVGIESACVWMTIPSSCGRDFAYGAHHLA